MKQSVNICLTRKKNMKKVEKEIILYVIFGILTTLVNILIYYVFREVIQIPYLWANAIAWFISVLFAFVTNKTFVFKKEAASADSAYPFSQRTWEIRVVAREAGSFFAARIATGVLDMILMWLLVGMFLFPEMVTKIGANIVVITINYILSKWVIFK